MAIRPENLPRDPDQLIEIVLACEGKIEALQATIAKLKTIIFGARSEKSAAIIAEQLSLGLGDVEPALPLPANDDGQNAESGNKTAPETRKKRNRNIGALSKHLPCVEVTIEPETTTCPCCAGALHRIGEDVNDVVDRVPAIIRILRTIRPKYACRTCEGTVVQAKARPRLIESGMASTALVAWIASAKFAWGSTLYRQAQILAGHGLNIDRQTLARWMKQAAWTVKGLYELQLAVMHSHPRLFCDETPVRMLDPHMGSFGSRGEIHSRIRKTPVVVSVSKVRARLHDLAVSSPDQPHIRSPFVTAAPKIPPAAGGAQEDETILEGGF